MFGIPYLFLCFLWIFFFPTIVMRYSRTFIKKNKHTVLNKNEKPRIHSVSSAVESPSCYIRIVCATEITSQD